MLVQFGSHMIQHKERRQHQKFKPIIGDAMTPQPSKPTPRTAKRWKAWILLSALTLLMAGCNQLQQADPPPTDDSTNITTPAAPTNLTASPSDTTIQINFTPGDDGGSPITNYEYLISSSDNTWTTTSTTDSPITITGLNSNTQYTIQIRAINTLGAGAESEPITTSTTTPPSPTIAAIEAGSWHSLALMSDGALYNWGWGGVLGYSNDGDTGDALVPKRVDSPSDVVLVAVAAGDEHTLALTSNGTLYAWGSNSWGQLGDGTTDFSQAPINISARIGGITFKRIAAGWGHSLALDNENNLYSWGSNPLGELGLGSTLPFPDGCADPGSQSICEWSVTPTNISALYDDIKFEEIAAGTHFSLALTSDGTLYTWGVNKFGALGNASTTDSSTPINISALNNDIKFEKIAAAKGGPGEHALALTSDGKVYAWGYNISGQLRVSSTDTCGPDPCQLTPALALLDAQGTFIDIAAGTEHSYALASDGTLYGWGGNQYGQLGNGLTSAFTDPPTLVNISAANGNIKFVAIAAGPYHILALDDDNQHYAWGYSTYGEVGGGSTDNQLTPTLIPLP